jgi:hypothetical protein
MSQTTSRQESERECVCVLLLDQYQIVLTLRLFCDSKLKQWIKRTKQQRRNERRARSASTTTNTTTTTTTTTTTMSTTGTSSTSTAAPVVAAMPNAGVLAGSAILQMLNPTACSVPSTSTTTSAAPAAATHQSISLEHLFGGSGGALGQVPVHPAAPTLLRHSTEQVHAIKRSTSSLPLSSIVINDQRLMRRPTTSTSTSTSPSATLTSKTVSDSTANPFTTFSFDRQALLECIAHV